VLNYLTKGAKSLFDFCLDWEMWARFEESSFASNTPFPGQERNQEGFYFVKGNCGKIKKMDEIEKRLNELQKLMAQPDFWQDKEKAQQIVMEYQKLKKEYERAKQYVGQGQSLFLGEYDRFDAILTITSGAGGTEAQDWAGVLLRMYLRFAEKKDWKTEILDATPGSEAGFKNVTIQVSGPYAFGWLKSENGVHRLVRISPFDADRARHTSFALVEVIPQIPNPEIEIKPEDLKIETFRASGPGGQYVQKTESAVRVTHLPTKVSVSCQSERSQLQNKERALQILQSKLFQLKLKEQRQEVIKLKGEMPEASWGNQIRSYVLHPYKMVKDHRMDWQSSEAEKILDGELEPMIQAYLMQIQERSQ